MKDLKWRQDLRTYVRYTSHPQCRSLKRTLVHLRRTAEQRRPRDAELRPVQRLRSRPRSSEPGLSGHGLPDCAAWRTAHGPFFQKEEICCTRSLVTPQKNERVKRTYFMLFFYLFGSCKRLTQSAQNSGSLWVNWEALPKQQWLERNKRNLTHPWRQTATVEIV